jgi:hypothetical protein
MAKYWTHLQYHNDTTPKRDLGADDIAFLQDLQHEMNTQDTLGQAEPRYWVIRDYYKAYLIGVDDGADGYELYENGDMIMDVANDSNCIDRIVAELSERHYAFKDIAENICGVNDLEDAFEECDMGIDIISYNFVPRYSNVFPTQKAAEDHLKSNHYHYDDKATTYAMTAWRSPEIERLWKILREVNWDGIKP